MQGLDLGTTDIGAMPTRQAPAPARESEPVNSTEPSGGTESFRAALRNEMSGEAAASKQSKLRQSALEVTAQTATRSNAGNKTLGASAVTQTEAAEGDPRAETAATASIGTGLKPTVDTMAAAKAGGQTAAHAATQADAAAALATSDVEVAARANAAAAARATANLATAGEKAIASARAKHGAQPVEGSDAPAAVADAVPPAPVAAVPVVAVAVPALAVQPKPGDEAGSDAGGGSVTATGTKRVRRALANQIEAGAAKTANAKAAQSDGLAADAGTTASASKDAKLAAVAEAGQAIAAGIASQAQTHATGLQPAAEALAGMPVQGTVAGAGSGAGAHTHDGVSAANGAVVSGSAEASLPAHQILSAGPTQLEVGVMDGTHGWLQIRAELGTGGAISTSLTGSAAAHAPLQQSVPEMTSYLASESVSVSGIAVHKASETAGAMAWGQGQSEGQAAGGSGTGSGGGPPTHDGKAVMDGARSGGQQGQSQAGQQAAATGAVKTIGLGWMGGVSPAVFASGFTSGGAALSAGTGSWLSVRV